MAKYQVLITSAEFRVVEANNAQDAEELALKMYCDGDIVLDKVPMFVCEEADKLEEENV